MSVTVERKGFGNGWIIAQRGAPFIATLSLNEDEAAELAKQLNKLLHGCEFTYATEFVLASRECTKLQQELDAAKRDVQELRKRAIRLEEDREALRDRVTELQERLDKMTKEQMRRELDAIIVAVKRAMEG